MNLATMYTGIPNSPMTTLLAPILIDATTISVNNASVLPAGPNIAVIGVGEDAETILYTAIVDTNLTGVTRALQGQAKPWPAGTPVARNFTELDYRTLVDNINALNFNKIALPDIYAANTIIYYVDVVNGNDANDGSQAAPFQYLSTALSKIPQMVAFAHIYLANGTYLGPVTTVNRRGIIMFHGNTNNPELVMWGDSAVDFVNFNWLFVEGITFKRLTLDACTRALLATCNVTGYGQHGLNINDCVNVTLNSVNSSGNISGAGIIVSNTNKCHVNGCTGNNNLYGMIADTSRICTTGTVPTGATPTVTLNGGVIAVMETL